MFKEEEDDYTEVPKSGLGLMLRGFLLICMMGGLPHGLRNFIEFWLWGVWSAMCRTVTMFLFSLAYAFCIVMYVAMLPIVVVLQILFHVYLLAASIGSALMSCIKWASNESHASGFHVAGVFMLGTSAVILYILFVRAYAAY